MTTPIKIIDLFAGPGGLGEGFFSLKDQNGNYPFEGLISVEKDAHAHATLTLRAFYRLLKKNNITLPDEYYQYISGDSPSPASPFTEKLWNHAKAETLLLEMGKNPEKDKIIYQKLKNKLDESAKNTSTLLIGGPPCQAYSLVGRARNKGKKDYKPEEDLRHELYKEYLRIMQTFSPEFFVMENVKGMLSSQLNGGLIFNQILEDLEMCGENGYQLFSLKTGEKFVRGVTSPKKLLLLSEEYGIPQNRHRVIIFGIRKNSKYLIEKIPNLSKKQKIFVEHAISELPRLRSKLSNRGANFKADTEVNWKKNLKQGISKLIKNKNLDALLIANLKSNLNSMLESTPPVNNDTQFGNEMAVSAYDKYVKDSPFRPITLHEPRPHMDSDLVRYFFCATFRDTFGRNPRADEFPHSLAPNHKNWKSGNFVDRFKVQHYSTSASTVTSHISKDGHYFIHSDPTQCRSLTVREAARLQTFPDSYHFMGRRTNQYHQIGNAVPPLLASQIAECIFSLVSK